MSGRLGFLLLAESKRPKSAREFWHSADGAKTMAAFAALIILGFGMVFLAYLGGRFTRRYMNPRLRPPPPNPDPEDWARASRERDPRIGPDNVE